MKRSNRLVLLVGVFLAVIAFVGIALLLSGGRPTTSDVPPVPKDLPTVLAVRDIPLGVVVTADMLDVQPRAIADRKTTAFTSKELVIGQVARRPIATGAQLEAADFDTSSTACGVIDVPATLRAIAIQVDQVSGVGTIINTGDYVDLLVGFTGDKFPINRIDPDTKEIVTIPSGTSVKLLLEGMQVLCRQLPPPPPPAQGQEGAPAQGSGQQQTSLTGQQEIVIVGVTPAQAEVIKFAQLDGSISMVLRSRKDFVDEANNPIIPPPSGTKGITLKKLTVDFAVPIPELVEAILPPSLR